MTLTELTHKLQEFPESQMKQAICDMVAFTKDLAVQCDESFRTATSLYRQARDWKKRIDERRKAAIEPDRARIAAINDKAKELTDPLDQIIEITNMKTASYTRLLEEKKKEEEAKIKEAAELLDLVPSEIYIAPMEKTIRGDGAIATTKIEKRFRVTDLSKVPLEYMMINESKIKTSLKLGVNIIPGIEIYEEKITQLRAR